MKFYNPTPWVIESMANGKTYYFQPMSTSDVWDMDHARILLKGSNDAVINGLVHAEYTDDMEKRFGSFEAFKHDQVKRGLKNLHDHLKESWINERQAEIDIKHHKTGAEADKAIVNAGPFEEKYLKVKKMMEEHNKVQVKKADIAPVAEENNGKQKRVYRRRVTGMKGELGITQG